MVQRRSAVYDGIPKRMEAKRVVGRRLEMRGNKAGGCAVIASRGQSPWKAIKHSKRCLFLANFFLTLAYSKFLP